MSKLNLKKIFLIFLFSIIVISFFLLDLDNFFSIDFIKRNNDFFHIFINENFLFSLIVYYFFFFYLFRQLCLYSHDFLLIFI